MNNDSWLNNNYIVHFTIYMEISMISSMWDYVYFYSIQVTWHNLEGLIFEVNRDR